jgi:hypothetical protein
VPQPFPSKRIGDEEVANLSERQIRGILAGVGVGSFVLLMTLDVLTEPDEINPLDLLIDAVTVLLTISAAVGVALLALRMQRQHEEKLTLIRDLELRARKASIGAPRCSRS